MTIQVNMPPIGQTPKDEIPDQITEEKVEKDIEVPKIELSENIRQFDKKPKVYTSNPYSYNEVSLKKQKEVKPTPSASEMITNETYNTVGKFLGIDTVHDWNKYYDKVYAIVEWAKTESKKTDLTDLIDWINEKNKTVPNVGNKNIDNLYLFARLYLSKK